MADDLTWETVRGTDLLELHQERQLTSGLPSCTAIYLWKLRLRPSPLGAAPPEAFLDWIARVVDSPSREATDVRATHFLRLLSIELRAGHLGTNKRPAIRTFAQKKGNRRWMANYIADLSRHSPGLYAGETGHLPTRIKQHLQGDSDFGHLVLVHPQLSWAAWTGITIVSARQRMMPRKFGRHSSTLRRQ